MAKQVGPNYLVGTIGDIVYYKMGDNYYSRFKGNYLSRKQMQRIPKFKHTLQLSSQFGKAAKLAGWVYVRYLTKEVREKGLIGKITGMAVRLLNAGKTEEEAKVELITHCQSLVVAANRKPASTSKKASAKTKAKKKETAPASKKRGTKTKAKIKSS